MKISTLDTTLRDGTQGEAVSFTVDDKLAIALKLDELGIDYIEGGWPGSNPRDKEFFARARDLKLKHARLTAFGSTRFAKNPVERDPNVHALLESGLFIVADATKDPRFSKNPLVVSEPKIRFYAGAPLITADGHALGTLCVLDQKSRDLRPDQQQALRILARHTVSQLELRRRLQGATAGNEQKVKVHTNHTSPAKK